ncbi:MULTISPECIES: VOC family protein [Yersinia]|uniref:VOC family protein n=1 Tax=Yersinia TaxID=629 RepID=UPI0005DE21EC|nr:MULTISPECIES: VOC family protein [Yersinia]OVZ98092.1 VOC family protein [Yersinia frederiksenii]RXA98212.1 VOC family protein [Yersinia sp. 2105 StPb PI]CNH91277.1 Uncharacterized protein conserved in bacteria [Yersinia frederiksenii]CNI09863.1 Uncharacterized protein conserved in bacteria [Yersinia frederiksenii]CNK05017.1 Uncharacterized protein conserved in bacteria [Yersinia frederiksenii]
MLIQPYLFFNGDCENAVKFYAEQLGGDVVAMMRYKDIPDPESCPPGTNPESIMHARLQVGSNVIMASDGCASDGDSPHKGYSLSINVTDMDKGEALFNGLSEGGQVIMPFGATFWAKGFGMLTDKFGVGWMINVE